MHPAEKLLFVAGVGRSMYSKWKVQRLITTAVTAAMCAVIAAVMISALAIGAFYVTYLSLVSTGATPVQATLLIGVILLLLISVLINIIRARIRELRFPTSARVTETVDAFLDGFFSK